MWPFRNISLDKKQREKAGLFSQHFASGTKRRERHIPVGGLQSVPDFCRSILISEEKYFSFNQSVQYSYVYIQVLSTLNNNIQYIAAREVYPFMV